MEETKEFLTKEEVAPFAKDYIKELYDIESYYLDSIEGHEEDKLFMDNLFNNAKTRSCTNASRKVVLIADPSVDKDTIARASLRPINNGYGYTIAVYFTPGFFNSVKGLKKMFEVAEQFIWHEATHIARMTNLGTDESHEGDITDIEYLNTAAELNAFAIQSLSTSDDIDLAMETYECCAPGEVLETFKTIRNNLKHGISVEEEKPLEESTLKEAKSPKCWNLSSPNVTAKDIKNYVRDLPDDLSVVIVDDKGYSHSLGAIEAGNDYLVVHTSCANVEDFKKYLVK